MSGRTLTGKVVSNQNDKTAVVLVETKVSHPLYKKFIKRSKKYHAHDEENACNIGDYVKITEVPPISKMKCWKVVS